MVIVMEHDGDAKSRSRRSSSRWWRWATTCTAPPASATPCWARWARRARPVDPRALELIPGVREVVKISEPYKLVGRTFKSADTVVDVGGREGRRAGGDRDGRPLLGGEPRAGARAWPGAVAASGARVPARRRLQAPHLALRLPGPRRGGAALDARGGRRERPGRGQRGHGPRATSR